MILLKNVKLFAPKAMGAKDLLMGGGRILAIGDDLSHFAQEPVEVIDANGLMAAPGLVDGHVHILGGGGEGGYRTRTPELQLSTMIEAGVTTVVGCLGTDGVARSLEALVAKAKGLREEGVGCYLYTGNYRLPLKTITGDLMKDIMLIDEIIGVGEVALSDHRSSQADFDLFKRTVADARVAGILSGKAGVVNIHMGDGPARFDYLERLAAETDIPRSQLLPTHVNRNPELFEEGIAYAKAGGQIDFTTSTTPLFLEEGEIPAAAAVARCLAEGIPADRLTMTSDGQGSLPLFDGQGRLQGLSVGTCRSLYDAMVEAVRDHDVPLEQALTTASTSPATILGLQGKGRIEVGADADVILMKDNLELDTVIAGGRVMMRGGKHLVRGTFESAPETT